MYLPWQHWCQSQITYFKDKQWTNSINARAMKGKLLTQIEAKLRKSSCKLPHTINTVFRMGRCMSISTSMIPGLLAVCGSALPSITSMPKYATLMGLWPTTRWIIPLTPFIMNSHQMETFSALLAICVGNSPDTGKFPSQRPGTRSFDGFFNLHHNKRLSKQW